MSESSEGAEEVGSLAEEAAKLFGALSGLAREHGVDLGDGLSGLSDRAEAAVQDVHEHVATGGANCVYCPLCRAIHVVRQTSPEVRAHLAVAASSLVQAAAGLLATAVPDQHPDRRADAGTGVEHIDLDGDVPPEDLDANPDGGDR